MNKFCKYGFYATMLLSFWTTAIIGMQSLTPETASNVYAMAHVTAGLAMLLAWLGCNFVIDPWNTTEKFFSKRFGRILLFNLTTIFLIIRAISTLGQTSNASEITNMLVLIIIVGYIAQLACTGKLAKPAPTTLPEEPVDIILDVDE